MKCHDQKLRDQNKAGDFLDQIHFSDVLLASQLATDFIDSTTKVSHFYGRKRIIQNRNGVNPWA